MVTQMKKRYSRAPMQMPAPRGPKATCSTECGNLECRVNLRNTKKGDNITVAKYYGTDRCRGYQKP